MDNTDYVNECIDECQSNIINTRKKYIKTIVKLNKQSSKIELKLLEELKLIPEESLEVINNFSMDNNLLEQLSSNEDVENKHQFNNLKFKLKNLEKTVTRMVRLENCDIYKKITENQMIN